MENRRKISVTSEKASLGAAHARRCSKLVGASHTAVSRVAKMCELKIPSVWRRPVARSCVGLAVRFVGGQTIRASTGCVWVRWIWHPGGMSDPGKGVATVSSGVQLSLVGVGGSDGGKYPLCCFGTSRLISSPVVIGGSGGEKEPRYRFSASRVAPVGVTAKAKGSAAAAKGCLSTRGQVPVLLEWLGDDFPF